MRRSMRESSEFAGFMLVVRLRELQFEVKGFLDASPHPLSGRLFGDGNSCSSPHSWLRSEWRGGHRQCGTVSRAS